MIDIMDREDHIDIDSMSYSDFVQFTLRADRQHSAKSTIVAFVRSMKKSSKTMDKEKDTDKPRVKDKDNDTDKAPPVYPPPVYIKQPSGSSTGYSIYEALVGVGVRATESERQQATALGKCSNCFNVKAAKYAPHTAQECPYTTPSCQPRTEKHTPITNLNGFPHRASDQAVIDAFIKERTQFLLDLPNNHSGKGSNSGKVAHTPTIPPDQSRHASTRHVTCQPMQLEETSTDDDDAISTPDEPPARGPIRLSAWAASASPKHRTVGHMLLSPLRPVSSPSATSTRFETPRYRLGKSARPP